jgi:hypothetical protein
MGKTSKRMRRPATKPATKGTTTKGTTTKPNVKRTTKLTTTRAAAAPKQLKSGASVPAQNAATVLVALNTVARSHNVDPAAIAGMINTESVWVTTCVTGQYIGLTQVGSNFVQFIKLTRAQFLNLPADAQINAYGTWLDCCKFNAQMASYNITMTALPLPEQAAVLQGMQFAPNGKAWKAALAEGDLAVRTTPTQQAEFLGDTSIGDMQRYYGVFFKKYPPVYVQVAASLSRPS